MKFHLQYRRYRLPFRAPVRTAHGWWAEREGLIVRLEDEPGAVGFGESAPIPHFGTESVDEDEAGVRSLSEWTNDEAMAAVPARLGCLRNALAAARADESGDGAATKDYLGVAALLPAGRAALAQIAARAESGFRVFKWKVGVADLADELVLLDDVCGALPAGAKLRLDANGAWDRRQAERWLERCAERPVEFVEQPCFAEASQGAARQGKVEDLLLGLAGSFPTPIALDESLVGEGDIERWIGAGWPGVFVVKPSLLGDVRGALVRLEKAKASVVFSSALETAVGAKAALRAAFRWRGEPPARILGTSLPRKATEGSENRPADTGAMASGPRAKPPGGFALSPHDPPVSGCQSPERLRTPSKRRSEGESCGLALGFGVWPLFADARCDGPYAAPFLRHEDVEALNPEAVWNALS